MTVSSLHIQLGRSFRSFYSAVWSSLFSCLPAVHAGKKYKTLYCMQVEKHSWFNWHLFLLLHCCIFYFWPLIFCFPKIFNPKLHKQSETCHRLCFQRPCVWHHVWKPAEGGRLRQHPGLCAWIQLPARVRSLWQRATVVFLRRGAEKKANNPFMF